MEVLNMSDLFDIAIIGTGPAGVSAAMTAAARGKSILLFGSKDISPKLSKAHQINNYPGFYGKSGAEIAAAFLDHLKQMHIDITDERITGVYPMGDHFSLLAGQTQYDAKTVIIASGVSFGKPYDGEEQFLGRGVSYCATCDGMLYKGKPVAVIGADKEQEKEAEFLSSICSEVHYIPLYKGAGPFPQNVHIVEGTPKALTGDMKARSLTVASKDGEKTIQADCFFILRSSIAPSMLLQGLAMDGNHIAVNRKLETNIPGCFAAGDITGTPYQYVKSAGEGNVAALSAAAYIDRAGQ